MTPIQTVTISPDGRLAAAGTRYGAVYLWQASNGVLLYLIRRGTGQMDRLHFLPDSERLAIGVRGKTEIWKVGTGGVDLVTAFPIVGRVAFTADGEILIGLSYVEEAKEYRLRFWMVSDGELLYTLALRPGEILGVSSNGTLIVSRIERNEIGFWAVRP